VQQIPLVENALAGTGLRVSREARPASKAPDVGRITAAAIMCVAACAALGGSIAGAFGWRTLSVACYVVAIVVGGAPTLRQAWGAVRRRVLDMHVLMSLAVIGAVLIGEWLEASVVVVLFALANTLESLSLARARNAIHGLLDLTPERATIRRDGADVLVPVAEVAVDQMVIVKPGERIPVDGVVAGGRAHVNQAPITGEARPVRKEPGDVAYAGALNVDGLLEIRVTRAADDSMPARIRRLVESAQARRAPVERFVDAFAARYTPAVVVMAILVALTPPLLFGGAWATWFYRALVLLVIACPCALVIGTPVAIVSHLAVAAREGILIKGGEHLERLGKVCSVVFDKTGTLTRGVPRVAHVAPLNGYSEREVLAYAAAVETCATHPLAPVICAAAEEARVQIPTASNAHTHPGVGVHASVDGNDVWVGGLEIARTEGPLIDAARREVEVHEAHGETAFAVGVAAEPIGVVALADTVRDEAADAIRTLRAQGMHHLYMLTGDNRTVADALAGELGLDRAIAELLPHEKVDAIQKLLADEHDVAMVGDGINDAPALAAATVGIAMSGRAADVTLDAADVAIARDDLMAVPRAIQLGRSALRIVRENIALAIGLKAIVLVLALCGIASLWLAILADMGASLLVIANALRPLAARSA